MERTNDNPLAFLCIFDREGINSLPCHISRLLFPFILHHHFVVIHGTLFQLMERVVVVSFRTTKCIYIFANLIPFNLIILGWISHFWLISILAHYHIQRIWNRWLWKQQGKIMEMKMNTVENCGKREKLFIECNMSFVWHKVFISCLLHVCLNSSGGLSSRFDCTYRFGPCCWQVLF